MRKIVILAFLASCTLAPVAACAGTGDSPVNLALFSPVQITAEEASVDALRLSLIYGVNHDVQGIDVGLVLRNTGAGVGVQWSLVGLVEGDFTGWQTGLVSSTGGFCQGLQSGLVNSSGSSEGVQWGLVNVSDDHNGLQLGLVNIADGMRGLQIGLVNVIKSKQKFPVLPLVNWSF